MIRESVGEKIFNFSNNIIMLLLVFITIYPLLHVGFASVSNAHQLLTHSGLLLWPKGFNVEAYKLVFKNPMILRGFINTFFIVGIGTFISIVMMSMGAYFLSRKDVKWQKLIMIFIIITMFLKGGLIPLYLTVKGLGLRDSLWSVIFPFAINTFYLIIMRTGFAAIPDSIENSAKIDGANDFIILFRIIMPMSMAIIAVMILYTAVDLWNSWFFAMIFIQKRELYPLAIILREILIQNDNSSMGPMADMIQVAENIKYAVIIVTTVPILLVYPFLQKYFVKGIMIGAVKG